MRVNISILINERFHELRARFIRYAARKIPSLHVELIVDKLLYALSQQGEVEIEGPLYPYLLGALDHFIYRYERTAQRKRYHDTVSFEDLDPIIQIPSHGPTPEEALLIEEARRKLLAMAEQSKEPRRQICLLSLSGYQPAEIAAQLNLKPATVRQQVKRIRDYLLRQARAKRTPAETMGPLLILKGNGPHGR